ncbi:Leucine-rich_repeat domain superfamily [Hexamita inflata]|uniref:Leucine-rich_repeat domain superfamily n=1 Tax=Hexamita inflata TaxID=28002 RepID=A0ABP1HEZ3_9EUKA
MMNIFNNQLLNNRIQKIFDSEFNMLSEFEYSDNTFGKLFLDVCLFFKLQEDLRSSTTNVQKALNMTSKWQFNKREQQLVLKYGTLSVKSIKMDIEQQIHLIDQNILNSLLEQQTNQENIFEIISMVLYTLKVVDDLKCIDENTTLVVRRCSNLTFDEVPTKISNLIIDNTRDTTYIQSLEGIQKMKQLNNLQIQGQSFLANKDYQILNSLENLTNLSLNDNYVDESELDFSQLNKLIALDLSNNKLQNYSKLTLPDNLKMLNVGSNNISCLDSFHFIRLWNLILEITKYRTWLSLVKCVILRN